MGLNVLKHFESHIGEVSIKDINIVDNNYWFKLMNLI